MTNHQEHMPAVQPANKQSDVDGMNSMLDDYIVQNSKSKSKENFSQTDIPEVKSQGSKAAGDHKYSKQAPHLHASPSPSSSDNEELCTPYDDRLRSHSENTILNSKGVKANEATTDKLGINGGDNSDSICDVANIDSSELKKENREKNFIIDIPTLNEFEIDLPSPVRHQEFFRQSDACNDADDEFECECWACSSTELREASVSVNTDDSPDDDLHNGVMSFQEIIPFSDLIADLSSPDMLNSVFERVFQRMLTVYPDLLGDQAPPPASPLTIANLPITSVSDNKIVCSICLADLTCSAKQLPCKHIFHALCIESWLLRTATCPVCRHNISSVSASSLSYDEI